MKMMINKIIPIVFFAVAFGLVEAAVAIYLREIIDLSKIGTNSDYKNRVLFSLGFITFLKPGGGSVLISTLKISALEIIREAATIMMLLGVALAVGKSLKQYLGYFLLTFGIWDIFYYIFLKIFIDWPKSLFDTDVFFLIPTPWIGPVITPIVISLILISFSAILIKNE